MLKMHPFFISALSPFLSLFFIPNPVFGEESKAPQENSRPYVEMRPDSAARTELDSFIRQFRGQSLEEAALEMKNGLLDAPLRDRIRIYHLPLSLQESESSEVFEGAEQRSRALHAFFVDVVLGQKQVFSEYPELAGLLQDSMKNSPWEHLELLRELWKGHSAAEVNFMVGSDIARGPDGKWTVYEDNVGGCLGGLADVFCARAAYTDRLYPLIVREDRYGLFKDRMGRTFWHLFPQFVANNDLAELRDALSALAHALVKPEATEEPRSTPLRNARSLLSRLFLRRPKTVGALKKITLLHAAEDALFASSDEGSESAMDKDRESERWHRILEDLRDSLPHPSFLTSDSTTFAVPKKWSVRALHYAEPYVRLGLVVRNRQALQELNESAAYLNFQGIGKKSVSEDGLHTIDSYLLKQFRKSRPLLIAPGTAELLSNKVVHAYVERFIAYYLGEKPILKTPKTQVLSAERFLEKVSASPLLGEFGGDLLKVAANSARGDGVVLLSRLKGLPKRYLEIERLARVVAKTGSPVVVQQEIVPSMLGDHYVELRPFVALVGGRTISFPYLWGKAALPSENQGKANVSHGAKELVVFHPPRRPVCGDLLE